MDTGMWMLKWAQTEKSLAYKNKHIWTLHVTIALRISHAWITDVWSDVRLYLCQPLLCVNWEVNFQCLNINLGSYRKPYMVRRTNCQSWLALLSHNYSWFLLHWFILGHSYSFLALHWIQWYLPMLKETLFIGSINESRIYTMWRLWLEILWVCNILFYSLPGVWNPHSKWLICQLTYLTLLLLKLVWIEIWFSIQNSWKGYRMASSLKVCIILAEDLSSAFSTHTGRHTTAFLCLHLQGIWCSLLASMRICTHPQTINIIFI